MGRKIYIIPFFCFFFIVLLQGQDTPIFYGKYPIQTFTSVDYKAGIQNIDFAQNRNRSLFVANNLGVLAYNGNEWKKHAFKTGIKNRSLAFDEMNNRLYVGAQGDFGFCDETWQFVSLVEKIPLAARDFDEVWDVFLFNTKVYFCTIRAIYVYDGSTISIIEHEGGLNKSFLAGGKLFTQSQQGSLFEIIDSTLIPTKFQHPNKQTIAGIIPQDNGYLLFFNSGAIQFTTPFKVDKNYDDLISALAGKYVNHVLQLSDNRIVVATQTSGLFLYDSQNQQLENITQQDGLPTNACLSTFQDYAGDLWVGTQNGMALIDINSPMRFVNQDIKIQGSGYDVFETTDGTYFTTSNGIYFLAKNRLQSVFLKGTEGPAYGLQTIAGKLYAGHHTGLFLLENGIATQLSAPEGIWQIKQLRSKPNYAIGGTYAGLFLFKLNDKQILQSVQPISGFDESSRFFEEDQQGRIWVSQFYKGLYQLVLNETLNEAEVHKIPTNNNFSIDAQIILSSIDNEFYLAAQTGIYQFNPSTQEIIKAPIFETDIGAQPVYALIQDQQKNIHVIAENAVGFFKQISPKNYVFVPSSLFQSQYYFNNDLLNISVNTNNGVWFNANEGFIHYRPKLEDGILVEKPLLVNKVVNVAENKILFARNPFALQSDSLIALTAGPGAKVLQFEIESFQFKEVNNQQFRYFLKGFDEDYSAWTNTPVKEYTTLPAGEYEFKVQTRNYLGEIITSQPLALMVTPPFYKSTLAKILYILLAGLLLTFLMRIQKQQYKAKAKKIQATNQQKLVEIEQHKAQELAQLKTEKMQSELTHLNNQLATSTMNLVVKNEFIETIKRDLNEVQQIGKNAATKRALEKIVKKIDTTLRIQEDWDQFKHHFNQVHGDFLTRLIDQFKDLSPNEQKLCAFLRLNLNTKDIANLMGISLRGVEIARYRLRKKLALQKGANLSKFILAY